MQAIFASKFYKASKNKDAIHAAMANPINVELVQQLSEYLDDEYKEKRVEIEEEKQEEAKVEEPTESSEVGDTSEAPSRGFSGGSSAPSAPSAPHKADHHLSEMLEEDKFGDGSVSVESDKPEEPKEDTEVSESTKVSGQIVTASEAPISCPVKSLAKQTDSIMGLLNTDTNTTGVRLVSVKKDAELWVYYKDAINLNNVMEPVIAKLNAANYSYLNFNRLARTDNAIVFDIEMSPSPVDPISEIEEE